MSIKPVFKPEISLGSLGAIIAAIGSALTVYGDYRAEFARLSARVDKVEEIGLARDDMNYKRLDDKIATIHDDERTLTVRIEAALARIEAKLDGKADKK